MDQFVAMFDQNGKSSFEEVLISRARTCCQLGCCEDPEFTFQKTLLSWADKAFKFFILFYFNINCCSFPQKLERRFHLNVGMEQNDTWAIALHPNLDLGLHVMIRITVTLTKEQNTSGQITKLPCELLKPQLQIRVDSDHNELGCNSAQYLEVNNLVHTLQVLSLGMRKEA